MMKSKRMDANKLESENAKFLAKAQGKTSWDQYEVLLANERVMNTRLLELLKHKKHSLDNLVKQGALCTYEDA